jgi:signal transduction histidine kinase
VFEPFFSTKSRDQGAGLGLWVADTVVRELGGRIRLDSVEDQGTTVTLDLPVRVRPERAVDADEEEVGHGGRSRISW